MRTKIWMLPVGTQQLINKMNPAEYKKLRRTFNGLLRTMATESKNHEAIAQRAKEILAERPENYTGLGY